MNDELFFKTWKEAVILIGPKFFGPKTPDTAKGKDELRPDIRKLKKLSGRCSRSEWMFIALVVSFYNRVEGEKLVRETVWLSDDMGIKRNQILAELICNSAGLF